MNSRQVFAVVAIAVAVLVLVLITVLLLVVGRRRKGKALTVLTGLALAFVLAGLLFGGNRWVGYGLLAIGVLLAVVDVIGKLRRSKSGESLPPA